MNLNDYISNGRTFKFINGPETSYTLAGTDINLSFLLFDFGERNANVCAAKMALLAANWQTEWTIQKVMMRVLENAYALFHAREVYQAALISLKEATLVRDVALELNRAGLTPITDLYTSQANLAEMKMELSRQKALLDIQMGKLTTSLGLPANKLTAPINQNYYSPEEAEKKESLPCQPLNSNSLKHAFAIAMSKHDG